MAKLTDLQQALRRNIDRVPELMKDVMQTIGIELEAYIDKNMQDGGIMTPDERIIAGKTINPTNQLRIVTGKLRKSLTPNGEGFAGGYETLGGGRYAYVVGIDLDVVPYARIHELGGNNIPARPYIAPALKEYSKDGIADVVDVFFQRLLSL